MDVRRAVTAAICVILLAVAASRTRSLIAGKSFNAIGEREWFEWAYRDGSATPLAGAQALLRSGEPVDLIIIGWMYDESWWRALASYYLPGHPVPRVEPAERVPPPRARTMVVIEKRKLHVVHAR